MDPLLISSLVQAGAGIAQTIGGAIQRRRAERAAQEQIGKLGPDQGILGYYNQALQRAGVSPTETALYKRQMQNIQRAGATGLAGAQGSRARMGAASSIARSLSDATLGAEAAAEQQQAQRFGLLGSAAQMAAAEKRRPEELRLQMMLQKAAGGTDIANTGLSNIFGALSSFAGSEGFGKGTGKKLPSLGKYETGTMARTPVGLGRASAVTPRISATPSIYSGLRISPTPTAIRPR